MVDKEPFKVDPLLGLQETERALCGSKYSTFDDFIREEQRPFPVCRCVWEKETIIIHCKTCSYSDSGAFCLDCFLNGNHEGHKYLICRDSRGNCDCGSHLFINPKGFCRNHQPTKLRPTPSFLVDDLRNAFQKAAFNATVDPQGFSKLCDWVQRIATLSPSYAHAVVDSLLDEDRILSFLHDFPLLPASVAQKIVQLFMSLTSDERIVFFATRICIRFMPELTWMSLRAAQQPTFPETIDTLIKLSMYGTTDRALEKIVPESDWVGTVTQMVQHFANFALNEQKLLENDKMTKIMVYIRNLLDAAQSFASIEQKEEFVKQIIPIFLRIEASCSFPTKTNPAALAFYLHFIAIQVGSLKTRPPIDEFLEFLDSRILQDTLDRSSLPLFERCTTSTDVSTSVVLPMHVMISTFLTKHTPQILGDLDDQYYLSMALYPVRNFSMMYQNWLHIYPYTDRSSTLGARMLAWKGQTAVRAFPLFALIQIAAGRCKDKEEMTKMILASIGLSSVNSIFTFLVFISNILTDRVCLENDMEEYGRKMISAILSVGPKLKNELDFSFWPDFVNSNEYTKAKQCVAQKVNHKFVLKNNDYLTAIAPFYGIDTTTQIMGNYMTNHPNTLLPFPPYSKPPYDLDLLPLLYTQPVYASLFYVLWESQKSNSVQSPLHISLNLILIGWEHCPHTDFVTSNAAEPVVCDTVESLVGSFPADFEEFLNQKIFFQNSNEAKSVFDIIQAHPVYSKIMGEKMHFLSSLNEDEIKKEKANSARNRVLQRMKSTPSFGSEGEDKPEIERCCVCDEPDSLCFPLTIFQTGIPRLLTGQYDHGLHSVNSDIDGIICQHQVHRRCIQSNDSESFCPMDRRLTNSFLLNIADDYTPTVNEIGIDYGALVQMMVSKLSVMEIVEREEPGYTEKSAADFLKAVYRNAKFLHQLTASRFDSEDETTSLCLGFIEEGKFEIPSDLSIMQKLILSRRQALLEKYCLCLPNISVPNGMILMKFPNFEMPRELIHFALPKYGTLPIADFSHEIGVSLFSFKTVCLDQSQIDGRLIRKGLVDHLNAVGGFDLILVLNGDLATKVLLFIEDFYSSLEFIPCYVNEEGDQEYGFANQSAMFLSHENLHRNYDKIFSGKWANDVTSFAKQSIFPDLAVSSAFSSKTAAM